MIVRMARILMGGGCLYVAFVAFIAAFRWLEMNHQWRFIGTICAAVVLVIIGLILIFLWN